ncbi:MAG: hypothetical protein HY815_21915 [Candidatus Riflebacteria bacterium]|nr:hypothetical protein [Candidatus Riflebacteria bacterium]
MKSPNRNRYLAFGMVLTVACLGALPGWSAEPGKAKLSGKKIAQAYQPSAVGTIGNQGPVQLMSMFSIVSVSAPSYYSGNSPRVIVRIHNAGGTGIATVTVKGSHTECTKYKQATNGLISTECLESKIVQDGSWSAKSQSLSKGQNADVTVQCAGWYGGQGVVTISPSLTISTTTVNVPGPMPK